MSEWEEESERERKKKQTIIKNFGFLGRNNLPKNGGFVVLVLKDEDDGKEGNYF